ncbi:nuclear transport factor 2 family protein [Rhodococcus fascians]|uniref:nuclear transport factor 2 family protein n=1 Tax=Nocardiaceae TaxID=85025 RepID=UPI00050BFC60|nr:MULTISPECIES: nuclear transport factor 2 family protein [Rhodococcus]MBY4037772.1 nuclear transport factor 2 family protein [Rhodococcus fascians]MBY4136813.1 nuclear transport factor 2 family protein [Rhodococcus fascians]MBY4218609.1 nuclear transport factor 2 family protein [Rhodococcus fascians]MBY4221643.1 nuclear transport factor 2 family protein [Rhodococcus fascians]MBY4227766.1 nuclear transport factor 2 family protein [Rhodococcus fascians]
MDRSTPAELARRNVVEVFNTNDDAKRRELIESIYHPDAVFYDAENTATGRESVIEAVRALVGPSEGLTFAVTAEPTALGDVARISWALSPPDAPAVVSGQDFVVVKDNLITELYTFIDQP